jgi:type II secretory pathway component GspD/PulD (secretin)
MFSLNFLGSILNNQLQSLQSGLSGVLAFGGGKSLIGIGIASVGLVGQMTHSASKILLDSQLRTMSGQKATLHIGQKYPILSGSYGTATSATGVGSITPAPSFTFQDLGLTLTTTPVVHDVDSVSLDIEAQFQVLTGASINGLPVISNRSVKNVTRLKFGEWAVVAGLMTVNEARTVSGLAGLSSIPFLSPLTSTHEHDNDTDQVILLLKPVLLTLPPNDSVQHVFRTGSENRPLTPL